MPGMAISNFPVRSVDSDTSFIARSWRYEPLEFKGTKSHTRNHIAQM